MQNVQTLLVKTANGIDSRSLAKSMVLKSFSLQYQTDAHPLLPLNNPIQKKLLVCILSTTDRPYIDSQMTYINPSTGRLIFNAKLVTADF
jgi:hypothetical protein